VRRVLVEHGLRAPTVDYAADVEEALALDKAEQAPAG
jgi:hypothetical protein